MKKSVIINSSTLGTGPYDLGDKLMGSFLRKLWADRHKPDAIVFYNSGVRLVAEGSSVLDALTELAAAGVDLIVCGTCAGYYGLNDKIRVGRVSDMQEIVSVLMRSDRVISV